LSPRLGINGNAVAKDHFAAIPAVNNADDDRRQDQPVGQHAGPAITSRAAIAECASAFIAHDGLRKRLWRQLNNPIAPRKFPTAIKGEKKLDDFLIDKSAKKGRRKRRSKR
jgi:hypothetical protein